MAEFKPTTESKTDPSILETHLSNSSLEKAHGSAGAHEWQVFLATQLNVQPDGLPTKSSLQRMGFLLNSMRIAGDWSLMKMALKDVEIVVEDETTWPRLGGKQLGILALAALLHHRDGALPEPSLPDLTLAIRLLRFLVDRYWVRKRSVLIVMSACAALEVWDTHFELFEALLLPTFTPEPHDLGEMSGGTPLPPELWIKICSLLAAKETPISLPSLIPPWSKAEPTSLAWKTDPSLSPSLFSSLYDSLHTFLGLEYGRRGITPFDEAMGSLKTVTYTAVVDGANVLYSILGMSGKETGGKRLKPVITSHSWAALNALCFHLRFKGFKPLIVLNRRHYISKETTKSFSAKRKHRHVRAETPNFFSVWSESILWTSRGLDDDWFAIGAALKAKAVLVTNDLFRDHVVSWAPPTPPSNESEALKRPSSLVRPWAEAKHMRYTVRPDPCYGWHVGLRIPSPIAKRIHPLEPVLHPPTFDGREPAVYRFAAVVEGQDLIAVL
jgi:hypothetical protein